MRLGSVVRRHPVTSVVVALAAVASLGVAGPLMAAPGDLNPAEQAGGGALPGHKPQDVTQRSDGLPIIIADPAPPLNPNYVDEYSVLVDKIDKNKARVKRLTTSVTAARVAQSNTQSELRTSLKVYDQADLSLADASNDMEQAARDLYIAGSTDFGVVIGVMGSEPDQLLRTLDSLVYVRNVTGSEIVDYRLASDDHVRAKSATSTALIRAESADREVGQLTRELKQTAATLKKQEKELALLIAAAAPQTVVGKTGCPKSVGEGTIPEGVDITNLCSRAVAQAPSPQAASAIKWALVRLGAPYACDGVGRLAPFRYDCSSYVSRAFHEAAGLGTATEGWAPSTRNMIPWDGASLDPHFMPIPPKALAPGDLVLYDTCPKGEVCPYRHVVMYLGTSEKGGVPLMAHTNMCGGVAHIEAFTGLDDPTFLGVRRVVPVAGEKLVLRNPRPAVDASKPAPLGGRKNH